MDHLSDRILDLILRYRKLVMMSVVLLSLVFGYSLHDVEVRYDFDIWFAKNEKIHDEYLDFTKHFGDDRSLVLIYPADSLFSEHELSINRKLSKSIEKIEGVADVVSLTNLRIPEITPFQVLNYRLVPKKITDRKALKNELCRERIFIDNIISKDGKVTALHVFPTDSARFEHIDKKVKMLLREMPVSHRYEVVGGIPLTIESARVSSQEPMTYLGVAIVLMILVLLFLFRNFSSAIMPVIIGLISSIWTLALLSFLGGSINILTGIIPLVLLPMSIVISIHLISTFWKFAHEAAGVGEAIKTSVRKIILPGSIAMFTTVLAFLTFSFSEIQPIRFFGLFTALGIAIAFVLSFLLYPLFFYYLGSGKLAKSKPFHTSFNVFSVHLARFVIGRRKLILLISVLVFSASLVGVSKLKFESDQLKYFKKNNAIRMANERAGEWFSGVFPFEMVFDMEKIPNDSIFEYYKLLQKLENQLQLLDDVEICHSANGFFQLILNRNRLKMSEARLVGMYSRADKGTDVQDAMRHFISPNKERYRITVKTKWINNQEALEVEEQLRKEVQSVFENHGISYYITGMGPLYASLNVRLLRSQLTSLGFSLLLVILILLLVYRKAILVIPGILPNLFPVMNTLGIMGFLGISIDVGTVLIASISLGVAIDDTVYFLTAFTKFRQKQSVGKAIVCSYKKVWKALSITTLILVMVFLILTFSNYSPIIYLGIFVSLSLFFALVYDFLVLPAFIYFFSPKADR